MIIQTRSLGEVEINTNDVIEFPEGILAFENYKKFVLISKDNSSSFKWLQSLEKSSLAFLVAEPFDFISEYTPIIGKDLLRLINTEDITEMKILCILTIPQGQPEKMTINLQGPILINENLKLGSQFISTNEKHGVQIPLFELIEKGNVS